MHRRPIPGGFHTKLKRLIRDARERLDVSWEELAETIRLSTRRQVPLSRQTLCRFVASPDAGCRAYTLDVICHFFDESGNTIKVPESYRVPRATMRAIKKRRAAG
jgi:hypothetical protein